MKKKILLILMAILMIAACMFVVACDEETPDNNVGTNNGGTNNGNGNNENNGGTNNSGTNNGNGNNENNGGTNNGGTNNGNNENNGGTNNGGTNNGNGNNNNNGGTNNGGTNNGSGNNNNNGGTNNGGTNNGNGNGNGNQSNIQTYTIVFKADGVDVGTYTVTVDISGINNIDDVKALVEASDKTIPAVPTKLCQTGVWENYTLGTENITVNAVYTLSHTTLTKVDALEPKCNAKGNIEYWSCSGCDKYFSDAQGTTEISKTSVVLNEVDCVPVDCECKWCGTEIHKYPLTHHARVEAQCNQTGNIEYWSCSKCNKNFTDADANNVTTNIILDFVDCSFVNCKCKWCGGDYYSIGLKYSLSADRTYYTVSGIDSCTDTDIIIPVKYKNKPVIIIESSAFSGCTGLTSVTIGNSVTSIGNYAFRDCDSLTSVTIGNSVTSIGAAAFYNCNSLTSVHITDIAKWCAIDFYDSSSNPLYYAHNLYLNGTLVTDLVIPDSVTMIGFFSFSGCTGLTSVTIPNSVTIIGPYAFRGCTGLTSVTIGNSVTSIGDSAFWGCTSLTSVTIPSSVTSIGYRAFSGCTSLTSVIIGNSVTSIGDYAFYNCTGLTSVTIPNSVTSIGSSAFYICNSLTSVHITDIAKWCAIDFESYDSNPLYYAKNLYLNGTLVTELVIPDSVTSIGDYAFSGCKSLTSVTIGNSVTNIGYYAFLDCTSLTSVHITDIAAWCSIDFVSYVSNPLVCAKNLYLNGTLLSGKLVIPEGVTSIGDYAFYNCTGLTSVTIPNSVTSIGNHAFSGCYKLVEVINKSSLTITKGSSDNGRVGYYALEVHTGESKIVNKDGYLFYTYNGVNYLLGYTGTDTALTLPSDYNGQSYVIYQYAFCYNSKITSVDISNGVTKISEDAFYDCDSLTSVAIGNGVSSIYYGMFMYCDLLTEINVSVSHATYKSIDGIVYSKDGKTLILYPCGNSGEFSIPNSVTSIGSYAFNDCTGLTSVTIPNSVTIIGPYAFRGCTGLTSVTIPDSVTSIDSSAFYKTGYYNNEANWENEVLYIGKYLIEAKTSISGSYTIKDGTLCIAKWAFSDCTGLTSITIPNSVTIIGSSAFRNCTGLTCVTIGNGVTSIGDYAFYDCTGLTSITIPNSVTSIGSSAFYYCTGLTSVIIGDSVTSISNYAFYYCTSLTSVTIGNSVTSIGNHAFSGCTGVTNVHITDIAKWCEMDFGNNSVNPFYNVENLYLNGRLLSGELIIPEGVTSIGALSFRNCTGLTSVTIPNSVTSIGGSAFSDCISLKSITIPDSVTSIGGSAFLNCISLMSVHITDIAKWCEIDFAGYLANPLYYAENLYLNGTLLSGKLVIPEGVTSIGDYAFYNCTGLTSVTIPNSVTSIGSSAFYGCYKLVEVINKSSLTITKGSSDNGYVGYYAFEVHNGESKIVNKDGYLFYTYNGVNYLLGYTGTDSALTLPSDYNGQTYEIYQNAFRKNDKITSVVIPDSVTNIGKAAFYWCTGLTSVTIGNSVTSIGKSAFYCCIGLTSITIPNCVTSIDHYAFFACKILEVINKSSLNITTSSYGLNAFEVHNGESKIVNKDGYLFYTYNGVNYLLGYTGTDTALTLPSDYNGQSYEIYKYAFYNNNDKITSVVIPDKVTSIGAGAFAYCTGLTCVTIGNGVTSIGDYAFYGCTGLTSVTIGNSVTSIDAAAFAYCSSLTSIKYRGTETQWHAIGWDYNTGNYTITYNYTGE